MPQSDCPPTKLMTKTAERVDGIDLRSELLLDGVDNALRLLRLAGGVQVEPRTEDDISGDALRDVRAGGHGGLAGDADGEGVNGCDTVCAGFHF